MKKIVIIILSIFTIKTVLAENINNITEIKYKWYKEEVEGLYYPKKHQLDDYIEDPTKIEYSDYSYWASGFCDYSQNYYLLEEKKRKSYDKIMSARYITFELSDSNKQFNDLKIYSGTNLINYKIINNQQNKIKVDLQTIYEVDTLWFYIDSNTNYNILITRDERENTKLLGYTIVPQNKIIIPDENWILPTSVYTKRFEEGNVILSPFIKNIIEEKLCRFREINTYRYKKTKIYYDESYHTFIENYIPDINDYVITYKNYSPNNKIEKEYVYIEAPPQEEKIINNTIEKTIYKNKYKYKDKIVYKTPLKTYIIFLIIILIVLLIKIIPKKVD